QDGDALSASFDSPAGVAVDAVGNVYVADFGNQKIRKISVDGQVSTLAGTGIEGDQDGDALTASFNTPYGVAVDPGGNVYVADGGNHKIRKISVDGQVSTLAGTGNVGDQDGDALSA
ncbi:gluconolaconase, partial [Cytophagales bacterium RKSG123]|nr:gluconolaconase [Xanthovirga aplysinae]